jgi:hypothetical protein
MVHKNKKNKYQLLNNNLQKKSQRIKEQRKGRKTKRKKEGSKIRVKEQKLLKKSPRSPK